MMQKAAAIARVWGEFKTWNIFDLTANRPKKALSISRLEILCTRPTALRWILVGSKF